MSEFWSSFFWFIGGGIVGALICYFLSKRSFEKQLRENPPISRKQIEAMYSAMGRKASSAQINQVMKSMGLNPDGTPKNTKKDKKSKKK